MKHDYDKILTRLTIILSKLYQGEHLVPKELAQEFGVSLRTIQRDFSERLSNFPLHHKEKSWRMDSSYKMDKSLSIKDTITLDILEDFSKSLGEDFYNRSSTIIHKLKNRKYSPIFTKLNMEDISDEFENMIVYEEAILSKTSIKIRYKTDKKVSEIKINPIKIVNFDGLWYLVATDKDNKLKSYYLKSITFLKSYKSTFKLSKKTQSILDNAISIWFSDDEPFEVIMEIDKKVSKFFIQKPISTTQTILKEDDSKITISVMATSDFEIIPIVKSWIPFIKVISPSRIDVKVKEEAKKFLDL